MEKRLRISWIISQIPVLLWVVVTAAVLLVGIWKVPQEQVPDAIVDPKARADIENQARGILVQVLGGTFFFVTAYFTWRNSKLSEDKQATERFSKAVEMLASDKLAVRLGGIFSLERFAKDSKKDCHTVMEILAAFVREQSEVTKLSSGNSGDPNNKPEHEDDILFPQDIQSILTVIGRREYKNNYVIDLVKTDLKYADLEGAFLYRANLRLADLEGASLGKADLRFANLIRTTLTWANLTQANLSNAYVREAFLINADLEDANLNNADFRGAHLKGANFSNADLRGADLSNALLIGTDLSSVKNLTAEQLEGGQGRPFLCNVKLPPYIIGIDPNRDCAEMLKSGMSIH